MGKRYILFLSLLACLPGKNHCMENVSKLNLGRAAGIIYVGALGYLTAKKAHEMWQKKGSFEQHIKNILSGTSLSFGYFLMTGLFREEGQYSNIEMAGYSAATLSGCALGILKGYELLKASPPSQIEIGNEDYCVKLNLGCANGDLAQVNEALRNGAEVNNEILADLPPIALAVSGDHDNVDLVRALLFSGANKNFINKDGKNLLSIAASDRYRPKISKLLIDLAGEGEILNLPDKNGQTPFDLILSRGDLKTAALLIEKCAENEEEILREFEVKAMLDGVNLDSHILLDEFKKMDYDSQPSLDNSFLGAVSKGLCATSALLIHSGANVGTCDGLDRSALFFALYNYDIQLAWFLAYHHRENNVPIVSPGGDIFDVDEIIQEINSIESFDSAGLPSIAYYLHLDCPRIVEFLIKGGAPIKGSDYNNSCLSPIFKCVSEDNKELVGLLLKKDVEVDMEASADDPMRRFVFPEYFFSPLHHAANPEMAKLILMRGELFVPRKNQVLQGDNEEKNIDTLKVMSFAKLLDKDLIDENMMSEIAFATTFDPNICRSIINHASENLQKRLIQLDRENYLNIFYPLVQAYCEKQLKFGQTLIDKRCWDPRVPAQQTPLDLSQRFNEVSLVELYNKILEAENFEVLDAELKNEYEAAISAAILERFGLSDAKPLLEQSDNS